MDGITRGVIERVSQADRERWLEDWEGAPADRLKDILGANGLTSIYRPLGRAQGRLDFGSRQIILNSDLHRFSFRGTNVKAVHTWTTAHEVGHWRLHRWEASQGAKLGKEHEAEAHYYAGCLLAPAEMVTLEPEVRELSRYQVKRAWVPQARVDDLLRALSARYRISISAMGVRLSQLGVMDYRAGKATPAALQSRITRRPTSRSRRPDGIGQLRAALARF